MAPVDGKRVCLGVITGASGVRGEVRVKTFTDDPESIGDYGQVETEGGDAHYEIKVIRLARDGLVARLESVEDRDAALALKGTRLYVDRASLPENEEDEYYHADLIGLTVEDLDGRTLGSVKAVFDFGAGEMLEMDLEGGGVAMLPFTREAVPEVLVSEGRIIANPPDGVLPKPKQEPKMRKAKDKKGEKHV